MEKLKHIDRRIIVGVVLLICSLVLWLVTTPQDGEKENLKNLLAQKNLELVQQQYNEDINNYNRALIMDNRYFCEQIINESMKIDCKKEVIRYEDIKSLTPEPEQNSIDIDSYNRALIMNNEDLCLDIQNQNLKINCTKTIQQLIKK